MGVCANCGHALGAGLFCTNCGLRADRAARPDSTAERAQHAAAAELPSRARYPLFADDVAEPGPGTSPPTAAPPPIAFPPTGPPPAGPSTGPPRRRPGRRARRSGSGWLPWLVGGVALLLVAVVGALLLVTDGGGTGRDPSGERATAEPAPSGEETNPPRSPESTEEPPATEAPIDLARYAAAEVPETATPNEDVSGNLVRYEARNLVDGVPETCWRMPGSGAGAEIVFGFPAPVVLTEVGLINGYAKTSGDLDWYRGNRRVLSAEWAFDDGTTVGQSLDDFRQLQSLPIDPVTTTTVTLRLLEVSKPGSGRSARDYTAISDVSLVGGPA
jgi:hypothetical protein